MRAAENGSALILALAVAALAGAVAATLIERADLAIGREAGRQDHAQALALAAGGIDYARAVLREDARQGVFDHPGEAWAHPLPPVPAAAGEIGGVIEDLQGRWNLNNLVDPDGRTNVESLAAYRRLLGALGLPAMLADTLADWIDGDDEPLPSGAERAAYAALPAARMPANRPLSDFGDLLAVKGYDAEVLARLQPHVAVMPGHQSVNVNFATPVVLAALLPGLDAPAVRRIEDRRTAAPFRDLAEFRTGLPAVAASAADDLTLAVASRHFLVRVEVRVGRAAVRRQALLWRGDGAGWSRVLWEQAA